MKWLLLLPIHAYWVFVPAGWRRNCLFRETCSVHVDRITREHGLLAGLSALVSRLKQCRGGYRFAWTAHGALEVILADGTRVPSARISDSIVGPFEKNVSNEVRSHEEALFDTD